MSKRRVAVYDSSREYIENLISRLKKKDRLSAEITGFTDTAALSSYLEKHSVEILLFSMEEMIDEAASGKESCDDFLNHERVRQFIYFGERRNTKSSVLHINKYQPVEAILKDLETALGKDGEKENKEEIGLYAVYSPAEGKSCIRMSLGIARELSRKAAALLIDMERFSLLEDITGAKGAAGISPLIYFLKTDKNRISGYIKKTVLRYEDTDIICAPEYMEDINELPEEEWPAFLKLMGTEGGYEKIVLNMGAAFRNITQIFEACEKIYIPEPQNAEENAKLKKLKSFIKKHGSSDIAEKMYIAKR